MTNFEKMVPDLEAPAAHAAAVTPDDTADLATPSRALYVGGAGNLSVVTIGGETVTLANVPAGATLPLRVARVRSTGTTASDVVALW